MEMLVMEKGVGMGSGEWGVGSGNEGGGRENAKL